MRKFALSAIAISAIFVLMASCASYTASPLSSLASEVILLESLDGEKKDVFIGAKAFNKADCMRFLDRDVIAEGYQPVQLFIQNSSDKEYIFSLARIGVSLARPEEVAERVHTSTVGRAAGYGFGALFLWPLVIPAIVDGIKSADANSALDVDFSAKSARDQVIFRRSSFNKLLFIPVSEFQSAFSLTLIEQDTNQPKTLNVFVSS